MTQGNKNSIKTKICIVGLGPAGIASALIFWKHGLAKDLICIDAGNLSNRNCPVLSNQECIKTEPCQILSGLGGCSLFGGKISNFPAGGGLVSILGSKGKALEKTEKALKFIANNIFLEDAKITNKNIEEAREFFNQLGFKFKHYNVYTYNTEELRKMFHNVIFSLTSDKATILFRTRMINMEINRT